MNHEQLLLLARRIVGADDAEDVVQTAYLKAHRAQGNFRHESRRQTWMYQITKRCALDVLRVRKRRPEGPLPTTERPHHVEPQVLDDVLRDASRRLEQLPAIYREALQAMGSSETCAEAAREVGLSVRTFKTRLSRARAALKGLA